MPKQRVIYNVEGAFIGPAPGSGYHFIDGIGNLHNNPNNSTGFNLVVPLHRVVGVSYDFNTERTELRALGKRGNLATPILAPPTVNVSLEYYQMGITNEARMGFYTNYAKTPYSFYSGEPFYPDNFGVFLLSGFYTKDFTRSSNTLGWPLAYRDKRNLFLAISKTPEDLNEQSVRRQKDVDVVGFGNCYITSYETSASVGEVPKCVVNYVAENMRFYSSGSGANIPAVNYHDGTEVSGVRFTIPSIYESGAQTAPSVIVPGDITIDIRGYPETTERFAYNGMITGGYTGRGNLVPYSNDFDAWTPTDGNVTVDWSSHRYYTDIYTFSADKILVTANGTSRGVLSPLAWLESGEAYEASFYMKSGTVGFTDLGVWDYRGGVTSSGDWLTLARFNLTGNAATFETVGNGTSVRIESLPQDWKRCIINTTARSGGYVQMAVVPNRWNTQNSGDYVLAYGSQLKHADWPEGYVTTFEQPVTGVARTRNIKHLGLNFQDLRIEGYEIGLDLRREPQIALNFKLPSDRKLVFPIYANVNFDVLVGDNVTGSLHHLIREDLEYDLTIRLANPPNKGQTGSAVRYDFIGAKFNGINYQTTVGSNKTANISFITELDPGNRARGMYMSGLFNIENSAVYGGYYVLEGTADAGSYYLAEDGGRLRTEDYNVVNIY